MRRKTAGVILITGASSGIGRACAVHLVRRGYYVFGTTRRSPYEVQMDLRQEVGATDRLEIVGMDVDRDASVSLAISEIVDRTGRLDGAVNCAGFGIAGPVEDTSDDEALANFETNLFGTLRVCRAVLPIMRRQCSGTIINISSIGGRIGLPFQGVYSATKFALEGLTEALRVEVHRFGIRVVLIEPGDFRTGFTDNRRIVRGVREDDAYTQTFRTTLSVVETDERNGASPESVASLVARILACRSPRVRYTIGPVLQRLAAHVKTVLPSGLFEWGLKKYYRVD